MPDAFAGELELLADLLERQRAFAIQAEAQGDDLRLARLEVGQHLRDLREVGLAAEVFEGGTGRLVLHQIAQRRVAVFAHRLVERGRAVGDGLHVHDLRQRDVHRHGDLVIVRFAFEFLGELVGDPAHLGDAVDHVDGETDRFAVGSQRPLDGLLDPPSGIGAELAALVRVEALDGFDQAEVAFADEVHQRQAEIVVVLGDAHHQAKVRLDHVLARGFVAFEDAASERGFLFQRQQRRLADLVEVTPDRRAFVRGKLFPGFARLGRVEVDRGRRGRRRGHGRQRLERFVLLRGLGFGHGGQDFSPAASPRARSTPLDLLTVSSYSSVGTESATTPAPACMLATPARNEAVRMTMQES